MPIECPNRTHTATAPCLVFRYVVAEIEAMGGIGFYCMAPAISDGNTQVRRADTVLLITPM